MARYRILVVDDEPDCVATTIAMLEPDHDVTGVTSPFEAVEHLKRTKFDLIVSDWKMPEIDGIELLAWVRRHAPLVGLILLTGRGEDLLSTVATGDRRMVVMLTKGVSRTKLLTAVDTLGAIVVLRQRIASERDQR